MIKNNDLIKRLDINLIERVLWVDVDQSNCYCIQILTNKLKINIRKIEEINKDFEYGNCTIIPNDDFYKIVDIDKLSQNRKEKLELRYDIVSSIDNNENVPCCFMREHRGQFIKKAMEEYKISEKTTYEYLRKYWQGGRTQDALIDNFDNCGKSKDKKYKKKPGRKSITVKFMEDYKGVIVDSEVKKEFEAGINRYYKNNERMTLTKTFNNIISDNYNNKSWFEKPTLNQFYNWYRNSIDKDRMEISRKGEKNYQNNVRMLKSDSVYDSYGPGFRYQVDATIFPIYLVNRIDRSLNVGKPIVLLAVDVFTTRIVGVHVCFNNESWEGYASLLYNSFQNKEKYCNSFGIHIANDDWNVHGSPKVIMGDRGGFINKHSDMLVKYLKVATEYAPSYTGSAKGTVEKKFDIIEKMIKSDLPAIVMSKYRERGKRDYRKDAKLDIYEFTQIVIEAILERNAKIMGNYPLEKELVWAGVLPSANAIWDWGIKNKTGALRSQPEDKLRFYLLRHAKASITAKGIKFKNILYTCELAEKENWFSRLNKSKSVEIAFDSRCMNTIIMYHNKEFIECNINKQLTSNDIYIDRTLQEIEDFDINTLIKKESIYRDINDKLYAKSKDRRNDIVKGANAKSEGNNIKVDDIKENRNIEKALYGKQQALVKNLYLDNKIIDETNNKCEDFDINNDLQSATTKNSRKVLSDFIRKKVVKDN